MIRLARAIQWLLWAPFAAGCVTFTVLGLLGELQIDLFHCGLAGLLGIGWFIGKRLFAPAALFALFLAPVGWHFLVALPAGDSIRADATGSWFTIEGTIRDRWLIRTPEGNTVRLLLGEVSVERKSAPFAPSLSTWTLAELEVDLAAKSAWSFRSGRPIRVAGILDGTTHENHRLRIRFGDADYHFLIDAFSPYSMEALRMRLKARAAYYLGKSAQAVYLPLVLDLRDRESPEGRDVIQSFRRVGISHLFAISGLNIAMIFGLLMVLQRYITWIALPGQGWVHGRTAARIAIVGMIWAYIALIGFPVTAVRAALMGSFLIWTELWGTRTSGTYVLAFTGAAMIAVAPTSLYDISFQLSFLAYFFLVLAMSLARAAGPGVRRRLPRIRTPAWFTRAAIAAVGNLWITMIVMLGLWPLIAFRFHNFSWLVFAGNLLLVPAMELALLPIAMVALCVSAFYAAAAPEQLLERAAFGALEIGLTAWVKVVHLLDWLGTGLVYRVELDWPAWIFSVYYAALLAGLAMGIRFGSLLGTRPSRTDPYGIDVANGTSAS